jgi:hypothetical protein
MLFELSFCCPCSISFLSKPLLVFTGFSKDSFYFYIPQIPFAQKTGASALLFCRAACKVMRSFSRLTPFFVTLFEMLWL